MRYVQEFSSWSKPEGFPCLIVDNGNYTGKIRVYPYLVKIERRVYSDDLIELIAYYKGESKLIIKYIDGCTKDYIEIIRIGKDGRRTKLSPRLINKHLYINLGVNCSICVNELIYNFTNMAGGLPAEIGDYNHFTPICLSEERFGVDQGDVCTKKQNKRHIDLCLKIYAHTGLVCRIESYNKKAYALEGYKKINFNDVEALEKSGDLKIIR